MLKHPMKKPGIAINSARCMACYACFMACKDEHCGWDTDLSKSQPEMGQYWMNIKEWERGDNERHIKTATVPTPCSRGRDLLERGGADSSEVHHVRRAAGRSRLSRL